MIKTKQIQARLDELYRLVGELADEFVLVGGSAIPFFITDAGAPDVRMTADVDVVVEVASRTKYLEIEEKLQRSGFAHDIASGINCRFINGSLIIDVMPTDEDILGFGNRWYVRAFEQPQIFQTPAGTSIRVVDLALFVCMKLEAFAQRGEENQKDLEDILALVNGRRSLADDLESTSAELKAFIVSQIIDLIANKTVMQDLEQYMPYGFNDIGRLKIIRERLQNIADLA